MSNKEKTIAEKKLQRNGSGYADPTAYSAIKAVSQTVGGIAVQIGSIWTAFVHDEKRLLLVVATHYNHATVLVLYDEPRGPRSVELETLQGGKYWVFPDLLSYKFYEDFESLEGRLVPASVDLLLVKTAECLGLSKPRQEGIYQEAELHNKIGLLKAQNEGLQDRNNALEAELVKLKTEYRPGDAQPEIARLAAQRDLYKEEYKELLASLIGK